LCSVRHKSRSRTSGSRKTGQSSGHESMGSRDTGIYFNTNSTESSGMQQYQQSVELISADSINPVCQPSEISEQVDDEASDSERQGRGIVTRSSTSFEKTSTWLLQQDADQVLSFEETDCGVQRGTQSNTCVGSSISDVDLTPTVASSRSEPVLLQKVAPNDNDVCMVRSSVTVVAPVPSKTLANSHSSSHVSAAQNSSRQKTRQIRFLCAADLKNSDVDGNHTFPSETTLRVDGSVDGPDGRHWVSSDIHNDVEDLSVEDGDGASLANSNTSLSDTCNSSFKSSTEDLISHVVSCADENSLPAASSLADVTPRVPGPRFQVSPGLRHRKRKTVNDGQSTSPARHFELFRTGEDDRKEDVWNDVCEERDVCPADSLWQSAESGTAAVGELVHEAVTTDDDDDNQLAPHVSPSKCRLMHARHARRPCSARTARSNDKFHLSHSHATADAAPPKDRGVRGEGRRCNVRIMDVRLLESTGISSAESDAEAARLTAGKSPSSPKASFHACCFMPLSFGNSDVVFSSHACCVHLIC